MITTNRLHGALASVLLVAATAYAEEPALTDPPADNPVQCEPSAQCPPSDQPMADQSADQTPIQQTSDQYTAPSSTTTTTTTTSPMPMQTDTDVYVTETKPWYEDMGYGLSVGGGVDDFVGDGFRDATNVGGSWNVRATVGTNLPVAGEISYIGSAQSIDTFGLDDDAVLVGNGLQGAVRVNVLPDYAVQPFLYGGAAWRHYELTDTIVPAVGIDDTDDVFEVPVGVGVAGYISGFMADVRAEYRGAWGADLIPTLEDVNDDAIIGEMDRWGITGSLGMEF